jgi:peroxiredoxin
MRDLDGLVEIAPEIRERGGAVVSISMDSWSELAQRQTRQGLGLNMLADPSGEVVRDYGLEDVCFGDDIARPAAFIIDAGGIVRWRNIPTSWRYRPGAQTYLEAFDAVVDHE